jgi:hypothetical protein
VPAARPPVAPGPRPALEPPANSLRQAGREVSAGLRPLAHSARRAVAMFLGEFPEAAGAPSGF